MDDWKVVSGGEEGLTCTWDQRMGTKLWEMHARYCTVMLYYRCGVIIKYIRSIHSTDYFHCNYKDRFIFTSILKDLILFADDLLSAIKALVVFT